MDIVGKFTPIVEYVLGIGNDARGGPCEKYRECIGFLGITINRVQPEIGRILE